MIFKNNIIINRIEGVEVDIGMENEMNKEKKLSVSKRKGSRGHFDPIIAPAPYLTILSLVNKPPSLEISNYSSELEKSHFFELKPELDSDSTVLTRPPFPFIRSSSWPIGRVSPVLEETFPSSCRDSRSHALTDDGGVNIVQSHSHSRIRSSTFSAVQRSVSPSSASSINSCSPESGNMPTFSDYEYLPTFSNYEVGNLPTSPSASTQVTIDKTPPSSFSSCPPIIFDSNAFQLSVEMIDEWTVAQLANTINVPLQSLLKALTKEREKVLAGYPDLTPTPLNFSSPSPLGRAGVKSPGRVFSPQNR
jgi:hypothetical protein